jgi:hypothetical protein
MVDLDEARAFLRKCEGQHPLDFDGDGAVALMHQLVAEVEALRRAEGVAKDAIDRWDEFRQMAAKAAEFAGNDLPVDGVYWIDSDGCRVCRFCGDHDGHHWTWCVTVAKNHVPL